MFSLHVFPPTVGLRSRLPEPRRRGIVREKSGLPAAGKLVHFIFAACMPAETTFVKE